MNAFSVVVIAFLTVIPFEFAFGYMDQPWTPPPVPSFSSPVDTICLNNCPPDPCADKPQDEQCIRQGVFNNLSDLQQSGIDNVSAFQEALFSTHGQITSLCLGPPSDDLWACVKNWNENHTLTDPSK